MKDNNRFLQISAQYPTLNPGAIARGDVKENFPAMHPDEDYFNIPLTVCSKMGMEPITISFKFPGQKEIEENEYCKIYRVNKYTEVLHLIKTLKPSLIHTHSFRPYASFNLGRPSIHTPHAFIIPPKIPTIKNVNLPYSARKVIQELFYANVKNMHVLTNSERLKFMKIGINCDYFVKPFPVSDQYYNINNKTNKNEQFIGVTVANMISRKNIEIIIEAVSNIVKEFDYRHYFIGFFGDNEYKSKILSMASKIPNICFLGPKPYQEIMDIYQNADLFVSSSSEEGQMIACSEACAAGIPACLSDIPPFLDLYKESSIFHKTKDSHSLYLSMKRMILNQDGIYSEKKKGCKCASRQFRHASFINDLTNEYKRILTIE